MGAPPFLMIYSLQEGSFPARGTDWQDLRRMVSNNILKCIHYGESENVITGTEPALWNLRGSMSADEYKNYLLGLVFDEFFLNIMEKIVYYTGWCARNVRRIKQWPMRRL